MQTITIFPRAINDSNVAGIEVIGDITATGRNGIALSAGFSWALGK